MTKDKILYDVNFLTCDKYTHTEWRCNISYQKQTVEGKLPARINKVHARGILFSKGTISEQHLTSFGINTVFNADTQCTLYKLGENVQEGGFITKGITCTKE